MSRRDILKTVFLIVQGVAWQASTTYAEDLGLSRAVLAVIGLVGFASGVVLLQLAPVGQVSMPQREADQLQALAHRRPTTRTRASDPPQWAAARGERFHDAH